MSTPDPQSSNTAAFYAQSCIAFGLALSGIVVGVLYLPIDPWPRAFLAVAVLFLVTSTFTLAKVVRDRQEHSTVRVRVDEARMQKLIAEHDPFAVVS